MNDESLNDFLDDLENIVSEAADAILDAIDAKRPKPKTQKALTTLFSVASKESKRDAAVELKRLLERGEKCPQIDADKFKMILIRLAEWEAS